MKLWEVFVIILGCVFAVVNVFAWLAMEAAVTRLRRRPKTRE